MGHALFAGHLDPGAPDIAAARPNMTRLLFLDPHLRELYADWASKAKAAVGALRLTAAQHPEDAALHALIGELSAKSDEFASMWADHRVQPCTVATYQMRHPTVGSLTVTQQTLSNGPGPTLVVAVPEPDSPSQAALILLAQATAGTVEPAAQTTTRVADPAPAIAPADARPHLS